MPEQKLEAIKLLIIATEPVNRWSQLLSFFSGIRAFIRQSKKRTDRYTVIVFSAAYQNATSRHHGCNEDRSLMASKHWRVHSVH